MLRNLVKILIPKFETCMKISLKIPKINQILILYSNKYVPSTIRMLHTNNIMLAEMNNAINSNLIIEDKAVERLRNVLDKNESLRIGVKGGGCSGFEYQFEIVSREKFQPDNDIMFYDGLVIVDKESLEYISGSTLEYEQELIRSGFKIRNNPLAEKGCSCGASFSLKF